jgi:hypothetical protein
MKRIREWARNHEHGEAKISLLKEDFLEAGHLTNELFMSQLHKIMGDELNTFKSIEKEKLIDPAMGDIGNLARGTLKEQDKKRITNEIVNGVFKPIGKVGKVSLQLAPTVLPYLNIPLLPITF